MRHHLTIGAAALMAAVSTPAAAQLFQEPAQRTIVLSPGWHLAGPPVRSADGLRFAVRSDAGVLRDMTVLRGGAIRFSNQEPQEGPARPQRLHKARIAPPHKTLTRPRAERALAPASKTGEAASTPVATASAVVPEPKPPRPAAPPPPPAPARTGPGYAHGVPINPLD